MFLNTLDLQEGRGLSALQAGLDTLPMAAMTVLLAPLSGNLVGRRGARLPLVVAGVLLTVSGLMLTEVTATTSFVWLFTAYTAFGIGFGVVNAPITNADVSGMPDSQAGVAAAVASTSRQIGQAVLGSLATAGLLAAGSGGTGRTGLPAATHPGWWVLTGCGVVVLVLAFMTISARARASAERTAELFEESRPEPAERPVPPGVARPGRSVDAL